jgi:hypothetical protein
MLKTLTCYPETNLTTKKPFKKKKKKHDNFKKINKLRNWQLEYWFTKK